MFFRNYFSRGTEFTLAIPMLVSLSSLKARSGNWEPLKRSVIVIKVERWQWVEEWVPSGGGGEDSVIRDCTESPTYCYFVIVLVRMWMCICSPKTHTHTHTHTHTYTYTYKHTELTLSPLTVTFTRKFYKTINSPFFMLTMNTLCHKD